MKTARSGSIGAALVTLMLVAFTGWADGAVPVAAKTKSFKGTVTAVDSKEKTFSVRGFWSTRTFNAGDHLKVSLEDKADAELKDLHPGQLVEVRYLSNSGVNVASQVTQKNQVFAGHVSAVDAASRTFKVKRGSVSETFVADDQCKVIIRNDSSRGLADLKIGNKVIVSYSGSQGAKLAQKVVQTGSTFTGTVEAIDADDRTLKAQYLLSEKKFNLAKDCPIIIDGKSAGKLSDLRIGDKLAIHYEELDGVLVATSIMRESEAAKPASAQVTNTQNAEP